MWPCMVEAELRCTWHAAHCRGWTAEVHPPPPSAPPAPAPAALAPLQAAQEAFAQGKAALGKELAATARSHGDAAAEARRRANASAFRCQACWACACRRRLWRRPVLDLHTAPFRLHICPVVCRCQPCRRCPTLPPTPCRSTNAAVLNTFTLDLHGQHVDEALASLERCALFSLAVLFAVAAAALWRRQLLAGGGGASIKCNQLAP